MSTKPPRASRASPRARQTRQPFGQTIQLDRGRVELATAEAFAQKFPEIAIPSLPFIGSYGIKVKSLAALQEIFTRAGLSRCGNPPMRLLAPFPKSSAKAHGHLANDPQVK